MATTNLKKGVRAQFASATVARVKWSVPAVEGRYKAGSSSRCPSTRLVLRLVALDCVSRHMVTIEIRRRHAHAHAHAFSWHSFHVTCRVCAIAYELLMRVDNRLSGAARAVISSSPRLAAR